MENKEELLRQFGGLMKSYIGMEVCRGLSRKDNERFRNIIDEAYSYALNTLMNRDIKPPIETSGYIKRDESL